MASYCGEGVHRRHDEEERLSDGLDKAYLTCVSCVGLQRSRPTIFSPIAWLRPLFGVICFASVELFLGP